MIAGFISLVLLFAGGDDEVSQHIKRLKDADPKTRERAAIDLGNLRSEAKGAVPALLEALKDKDGMVRSHVIGALGNICFTPNKTLRPLEEIDEKIVGALIPFIDDKVFIVRLTAMSALSSTRGKAKNAVPLLIKALKDETANVRASAAGCLGAIGPEARAAAPHLRVLMENKEENENVRKAAYRSLEAIEAK